MSQSYIPEVQTNIISNSSARLMVAYNMMYNVTIVVSQPCDVIIFTKVYHYPCARECMNKLYIKCMHVALINSLLKLKLVKTWSF